MTLPEQTSTAPICLTIPAANAVRDILSEKKLQGYALRLYISGGGCSGYQYGLALDNRFRAEDTIIETDGIKLIIDEVSIKYLQGTTVDYVDGAEGSGFKIINPNPISTCNCGESPTDGETSSGCAGCG